MTEVERFCGLVGLKLESFQHEMMEAVLSDRREVVISQPRGAGRTPLLGCYVLWELVRHPEATIIAAAASRDQAHHLFRAAERFAVRARELRHELTFTMREIRTAAGGHLLVVSADSEKQMGYDPFRVIVDELGSHTDDRLYISLRSALIKNPDARMRIISTMGGHEEAPMPSVRAARFPTGTFVPYEFGLAATVRYCLVPSLKGKTPKAARAALTANDCTVGKAKKTKKVRRKKTVLAQSVAPGTSISDTAPVNLKVSRSQS